MAGTTSPQPESASQSYAPSPLFNYDHTETNLVGRTFSPTHSRGSMRAMSTDVNDPLAAAKLAALASPCFFHRRIDDAVNIDKVLDEITRDESMSHSRLLQTATSVREVAKQLQRRPMKRAVRTVMIVTKARDNGLVVLTRELTEWLLSTPRYGSSMGVTVYVDAKLRKSKRFDAPGLVTQQPRFEHMLKFWTPDICWTSPEKFDLVLTLGGDGTVLFTSWLFQRIVPPILSFSLGSLGFLTPFDFENYRNHLNHVMGGINQQTRLTSLADSITSLNLDSATLSSVPSLSSTHSPSSTPTTPSSPDLIPDAGMRVNLRMRFTCNIYRSTPPVHASQPRTHLECASFEVLNELVIDRGPSPYVSNLELYDSSQSDGGTNTLLTVIQADGVIFSTPTGSTAYSLSAGGALVHPDIPAILLTPICPHTLSFRPMLLNDTMALKVAVPKGSRATAWCSFDGKGRVELRQGDYVTIGASRYPFPVVEGGRQGGRWIDSVSRTLRWNTRGARQKGWNAQPRGSSAAGSPEYAADNELDAVDGEEEGEPVQEVYDIDFDDEDDEKGSSKDSGYDGDGAGSSVATPLRRSSAGIAGSGV